MRRELPIRAVGRWISLAVLILLLVPAATALAEPLVSPGEVPDVGLTEQEPRLSERARKRLAATSQEIRAAVERERKTASRKRARNTASAGEDPRPLKPAEQAPAPVNDPAPRAPLRKRSSAPVTLQQPFGSSTSRAWSFLVLQPVAAPVAGLLDEPAPPSVATAFVGAQPATSDESASPLTDQPGVILAVMLSLMGVGVVIGGAGQAWLPSRAWVTARRREL